MSSLYLFSFGGVPNAAAVRIALEARGIRDFKCRPALAQGCGALELECLTMDARRQLLECRELIIDNRLAFITSSKPPKACTTTAISPGISEQVSGPNALIRRENIYKVCMTGGPCAGKTTALSTIMSWFGSKGIRTFAVPEAATVLITGGMAFSNLTPEKITRLQTALLQTQLNLEQRFLDIACADPGPALIVCDRGAMDGKAYCDSDMWDNILERVGMNEVQLRDQNYDAVFHLVTAADGAEKFYGTENNAARTETCEQAKELDGKTKQVYLAHPHHIIVDNSTDFAAKVDRVIQDLSIRLGVMPPKKGAYRRYLVKGQPPEKLPVPSVRLDISISVLAKKHSRDPELRILARGQNDMWSYYLQELRDVEGSTLLTEKLLTYPEYVTHQRQVDRKSETIMKSSLSFVYENQAFELGTFIEPEECRDVSLLYVQADESGPTLPLFIPIEREVTNEDFYSHGSIAQAHYTVLDDANMDPGDDIPTPEMTREVSKIQAPRLSSEFVGDHSDSTDSDTESSRVLTPFANTRKSFMIPKMARDKGRGQSKAENFRQKQAASASFWGLSKRISPPDETSAPSRAGISKVRIQFDDIQKVKSLEE